MKNKLLSVTIIILLGIIAAFSFSACNNTETPPERKLERIEIASGSEESYKTEYVLGDELDVAGLSINAIYSNGDTEPVSVGRTMVADFDSSTPIEQLVLIITYQGKTTQYNVKIRGPESIRVKSTDHKIDYNVDETLDVSNLVIEADFGSGIKKDIIVTADMVDGFDSSAAKNNLPLTISYGGRNVQYDIKIIAPVDEPETIAIISDTHKTQYELDEDFDISGLEIEVQYNSGAVDVMPVTSDMVSGFDSSSYAVDQVVTVSYGDLSVSYLVNIGKATSFSVLLGNGKTLYRIGETLNTEGIKIALSFSFSDEKVILDIEPSWIKGFDSSKVEIALRLDVEYEVWKSKFSNEKKILSREFYVSITSGDIYMISDVEITDMEGNPYTPPRGDGALESYANSFIELRSRIFQQVIREKGAFAALGGYWSMENDKLVLDFFSKIYECTFEDDTIILPPFEMKGWFEEPSYLVTLTFTLSTM